MKKTKPQSAALKKYSSKLGYLQPSLILSHNLPLQWKKFGYSIKKKKVWITEGFFLSIFIPVLRSVYTQNSLHVCLFVRCNWKAQRIRSFALSQILLLLRKLQQYLTSSPSKYKRGVTFLSCTLQECSPRLLCLPCDAEVSSGGIQSFTTAVIQEVRTQKTPWALQHLVFT